MMATASLSHPVAPTLADQAASARSWDSFVGALPAGDIVQTSAWARAKEALGFDSELVTVERDGLIAGGGLLLIRKVAPGLRIGMLPRGPLLREADPDLAAEALDKIVKAGRRHGVAHLLVQPPAMVPDLSAALTRCGFRPGGPSIGTTATLVSDLTVGRDAALARLAASRRRRLRRAEEQGVTVWTGGADDLPLFHELHAMTARRQGFTALSLRYLQAHWDALAPVDGCALIFAGRDRVAVAARWLTAHGGTVTGRLSGWNDEDRHLHAPLVSAWGAVCWAIERGYRWFDFGGVDRLVAEKMLDGSATPELLQRSAAAFKADFGTRPVLLPTTWQLSLVPLLRPLAHRLVGGLAEPGRLRATLARLRNGGAVGNA